MLKIGIIGSGFGLYGLLPAFSSLKKCQVVSICGKNTDRLKNYCQSIGLKNIYTDWQEMLNREKLDALALAVTPNAQYQIAKVAIKKKLHIFAEKPLAANYNQAKELLELAIKFKIVHMIDFIFPEIPEWQKVKQLIDKKTFGKLKHISLNWDFLSYDIKNKKASWKTNIVEGGGALSFYFSHSLYYLEYYGGQIKNIKSLLSYSKESLSDNEVGTDLLLEFENGVNGYAHLNCTSVGLNRHQIIFQCEKGTIILENINNTITNFVIRICAEEKDEKLSISKETTNNNEDERVRIIRKIAARFINSCIHKKTIIPSFEEGVRVQKLIEKIRLNS